MNLFGGASDLLGSIWMWAWRLAPVALVLGLVYWVVHSWLDRRWLARTRRDALSGTGAAATAPAVKEESEPGG